MSEQSKKTIAEKVEERLREKQATKEFKDTEGRIGGSKKEKMAYKMVSVSDLADIEKDEVLAIELVKKDKVYSKVDVNAEREKGVSSGCAFLKVKLRDAFGSAPPNNVYKRKIYTGYATLLFTQTADITSVKDFEVYAKNIMPNTLHDVIKMLQPDLVEQIEDERKQKTKDKQYFETKISELAGEIKRLEESYNEETDAGTQKAVDYQKMKDDSWALRKEANKINIHEITDIEENFIRSIGYQPQGTYWLGRTILEDVIGKRFVNFITEKSDSVKEVYKTAVSYESLSLPESLKIIDDKTTYTIEALEKNRKTIIESEKLSDRASYNEFFKERGGTGFHQYYFNGNRKNKWFRYEELKSVNDIEIYTKMYLEGIKKRIAEAVLKIDKIKEEFKPRENNWDWFFGKKKGAVSTKERAELKVNSYPPLSFIKRTGGIKIVEADITPDSIREKFGFKEVEFGQSLKDKEAKEHIRHFLGSMADFGDILNMNIVELNQLGGLSIAFASRGSGRASAHYEPLRKVINITKVRGGGAVAHEYMHYLDNILPKINRAEYSYKEFSSVYVESRYGYKPKASIENQNVFDKIYDIFNYIYNRKTPEYIDGGVAENETAVIKKVVNASEKGYYLPTSFTPQYDGRNSNAPQIVPTDIEEYWTLFLRSYSQYRFIENLKAKDFDIIGAIVKKFGFESYEFSFKTNKSLYYANSLNMGSDYWSRAWELFARAFETFVFDKLDKAGRVNNYLVSGDYFGRPEGVYPYGQEREHLFLLYDNLMTTIKTEYAIGDFKAWTTERVDEYIALEGDEKETTKAGIIVDEDTDKVVEVITPAKKGAKKGAKKEKATKSSGLKFKLMELLVLLDAKK